MSVSTTSSKQDARSVVFNLPNQLTWMRLLISVVMFVTLTYEMYLTSLVLFTIAASTDWLDGYFARKYDLVTTLGRILDPFADKVIICGTFIFLAAVPQSGIVPWMAVVVVGRELLVTALRGFIEQQGGDFSAKMAGKLKMVLQCLAAILSMYCLYAGGPEAVSQALRLSLTISVWAAVALTVYSGAEYIFAAINALKTPNKS